MRILFSMNVSYKFIWPLKVTLSIGVANIVKHCRGKLNRWQKTIMQALKIGIMIKVRLNQKTNNKKINWRGKALQQANVCGQDTFPLLLFPPIFIHTATLELHPSPFSFARRKYFSYILVQKLYDTCNSKENVLNYYCL